MTALYIVSCNVLLLVGGQILWKLSLSKHPLDTTGSLLTVLLQPYLLMGCLLYSIATVIWFYALSRYDLSRVYPLQSLAYVLGALAGGLVFKETISSQQWMGMVLLIGGAYLLSR